VRTVESIEAGNRVKRVTLAEVAHALDVAPETIIAPPRAAADGTHRTQVVIELVLDPPAASFTGGFTEGEREEFQRALKERLSLSVTPRVMSRPGGSVAVPLELTVEEGGRLFREVVEERLNDLKIGGALNVRGVRLIVATDSRGDARTDPGPHPLPPPHDAPKCSLLVVDDEADVRGFPRSLLKGHFQVQEAASADAAEEAFRSGPVDLILTDQKMPPGRTGVELLTWVRKHYPRTIRLLMTGYEEFEDTKEAINSGHVYHYFTKPLPADLLGVLLHAAEKFALERRRDQLLERLKRSNRKLRKANQRLREQIEREALTDPVTGLLNRRAIEEQARSELKRRIRYPKPLSIGLIDVGPFDLLSNEHLRAGGDEVLERLVRILAGALRAVDSVGRLHGGRFLVIARETGEEGAARLGERLRATIASAHLERNGRVIPITLCIGFAVADGGVHPDLQAMTEVALDALAHAREAGGNRCEVRRVRA
jgi:diguanylate cyclase (GGDEF)-like protein